MFRVQEVKVNLSPYDMPGPTRRKATCLKCGQVVRDNREVRQNGFGLLPALRFGGLLLLRLRRSPGQR